MGLVGLVTRTRFQINTKRIFSIIRVVPRGLVCSEFPVGGDLGEHQRGDLAEGTGVSITLELSLRPDSGRVWDARDPFCYPWGTCLSPGFWPEGTPVKPRQHLPLTLWKYPEPL